MVNKVLAWQHAGLNLTPITHLKKPVVVHIMFSRKRSKFSLNLWNVSGMHLKASAGEIETSKSMKLASQTVCLLGEPRSPIDPALDSKDRAIEEYIQWPSLMCVCSHVRRYILTLKRTEILDKRDESV